MVVKSDDRREPFDPQKLMVAMLKACTKRPVSTAQLEEVAEWVEHRVAGGGESEVSAREIGELVMQRLRTLDEVAYVRFASIYRDFQDRTEFLRELQALDASSTADILAASGEE